MTTRITVSAAAWRMPGRCAATKDAAAWAERTKARRMVMTILPIFRSRCSSELAAGELPLGDARQQRRSDRQDAVVENVAGIVHRRTRRLPEPEIGARHCAQHVGEILAGHFRPRFGVDPRVADDLSRGFAARARPPLLLPQPPRA